MMNNTLKARIVHKHELERDWKEAINFIPLQGEIIVYIPDSTHSYSRLKIGDGITPVNDLPFFGENKQQDWGNFVEPKQLNWSSFLDNTVVSSDVTWENF